MRFIQPLYIVFAVCISLYFAIGSYSKLLSDASLAELLSNKHKFDTVVYEKPSTIPWGKHNIIAHNMFETLVAYEQIQIAESFPLVDKLPALLVAIIATCSFCVIGLMLKVLYIKLLEKGPPNDFNANSFLFPVFGLLVGVVVYFVVIYSPQLLFKVDSVRPVIFALAGLLAGFFTEQFFQRLSKTFF